MLSPPPLTYFFPAGGSCVAAILKGLAAELRREREGEV
jgi:hypothetical protein